MCLVEVEVTGREGGKRAGLLKDVVAMVTGGTYLVPHRASCWPGCRCPEIDPDWCSRTPPLDCPRPPPYTLSSWQSWTHTEDRQSSIVKPCIVGLIILPLVSGLAIRHRKHMCIQKGRGKKNKC